MQETILLVLPSLLFGSSAGSPSFFPINDAPSANEGRIAAVAEMAVDFRNFRLVKLVFMVSCFGLKKSDNSSDVAGWKQK